MDDFFVQENRAKPDRGRMYPNFDENVWLRSCSKEIIDPLCGKITGTIPNWLSGSLIYNGPGSDKAGCQRFQHIFDFSALLRRFAINNGKVTYQCRFLQSEAYKKNWKANRIVVQEFGTKSAPDRRRTLFEWVTSIFTMTKNVTDNTSSAVYPFGDENYAITEGPTIIRINKTTLETETRHNLWDVMGALHHTAHPYVMEDGSVYNLETTIKNMKPNFSIAHFPCVAKHENVAEKARFVSKIPARWPIYPSYMHSFGLTENYFIIIEQPISISVPFLVTMNIDGSKPLKDCLKWHGDEYTQISLVSRKTGKVVRKYKSKAFFFMHVINQYEEKECIILDICCYKDASMLDCLYVKEIKNMQRNAKFADMFRARPLRFALPFIEATESKAAAKRSLPGLLEMILKKFWYFEKLIFVEPELLCDVGCEMPQINLERHMGKKYRYFYAIGSDVDAENPGMLIKIDTVEKTKVTWREGNCYPSEPVFVSSPNAEEEDDGVVLASIVWGGADTDRVGLIILDAKTFKELGRAEFETPGPVPQSLHGRFLKAEGEIKDNAKF